MVIYDFQPRAHTFNPEFWPHLILLHNPESRLLQLREIPEPEKSIGDPKYSYLNESASEMWHSWVHFWSSHKVFFQIQEYNMGYVDRL